MTLDPYANTTNLISDEEEWNANVPVEKMGGSARMAGRSRSLLWPRVYDALKEKGYDSSKAAAISNAHWNKYRRWGKAGKPGPKSMADRKEAMAKGFEPGADWSEGWDSFLSDSDIVMIVDDILSRLVEKYDPNQPRDEQGQWTTGGARLTSVDGEGKGLGDTDYGVGIKLAFGGGDGTKDKPFITRDVDQAAKWLAEDKYVELRRPEEVATLLEKLQDLVADAKAKGDKAPNYDLCKVSVPKTNLFCAGNKGIARSQMPQLSGKPIPGSEADKLPKNDKGEVNLGPAFVKHLIDQGIKVTDQRKLASHLRASQREINGGKVAGMVGAMEAGKMKEGSIFTTRDDYVVDGHHRWAATVGTSLLDRKDLDMPVQVIDTDIVTALRLANAYSIRMGIPQASVSKGFKEWFLKGMKRGAGGKQQAFDEGSGRYMSDSTHESSVESALEDVNVDMDIPPQNPGEPDFAYQSRVCNLLPPDVRHEVLARIREHTRTVPYLTDAENEYRADRGLPHPQVDWDDVRADLGKAQRIVATLDGMQRDPNNPKWKAAYEDFKQQNEEMWSVLIEDLGVTVSEWDERTMGGNDPYDTAEEQALDLQNNRHLWINRGEFFINNNPDSPTGTDHPFMTGDEYFRFRAVHDAFGHAAIGSGFDRHGEYTAWMAHTSMYTGEGRKAMSTEYHGVNSYLWASGGTPLPKEHWGVIMPDELIGNVFDDSGRVVRKWYSNELDSLISYLDLDAEFATKFDNNFEETGTVHSMGYSPSAAINKATKVGAGQKPQEFDSKSGRYMTSGEVKSLLDSQDGFTVDPRSGKQPKEGFAVGVKEEHSLIMHDDSFSDAEVDSWMQEHMDQPELHVGGWHDKANKKYVLDVVHVDADEATAIQLAQEHNQVAIYDLKQGKEIETGGTGGYKVA